MKEINEALTAVVGRLVQFATDRLVQFATEDPTFRCQLLHLLETVQVAIKNTENRTEKEQDTVPEVRESFAAAAPIAIPVEDSLPPVQTIEPVIPPLDGAAAAVAVPTELLPATTSVPQTVWIDRGSPSDDDLKDIEARCRLKSEASRWAMARRRLLASGASFRTQIEPKDQQMIEEGKSRECYLWMCRPDGPSPLDPGKYEVIAACFEVLAEALSFVRLILELPDSTKSDLEAPLLLLAEAQSGLRIAVAELTEHEDAEQEQVFRWLRTTTEEKQIFVRRYMKLNDPADPSKVADLLARIRTARSDNESARKAINRRKKLFGKIRHKLSLLPTTSETERPEIWRALAVIVDELVSSGLPPSDKQLREHLLPVLDDIPELPDLPKGFLWFQRECERFRLVLKSPEAPDLEEEPSADVQAVARLLAGRSMVLIGGDPRPEPREALERAFGLRELIWVPTREHQSVRFFEPAVARPEVAVVLLAIRWSSHSYAEVQSYCEQYGKALVRLPGGYNPNQVALQVLAQRGERLADE